MEEINCIGYSSLNKISISENYHGELYSMVKVSRINNAKNDISGALIVTAKYFFQILEGNFDAVNSTMSRIRRDPRHCEIEVHKFCAVKQRSFSKWAMTMIEVSDLNGPLLLDALGRLHGGDRRFVEIIERVAFDLTYKP